jgi:predicted NAD-dependent protein-ADP-ribosyltransferase YbiA (DUF1768 family)
VKKTISVKKKTPEFQNNSIDKKRIYLNSSEEQAKPPVFVFFSKSKDMPPGKGTGESIGPNDDFKELAKIKNWRHMLSNFYNSPFELDNLKWYSVEHYYQGSKFKLFYDFYYSFSLNSNSPLSKDPTMAKQAGGKSGKVKGMSYRSTMITVDRDFFTTNRHIEEMNTAQNAKFTQNKELMKVLILTKNAILKHSMPRTQAVIFENLMRIRDSNK